MGGEEEHLEPVEHEVATRPNLRDPPTFKDAHQSYSRKAFTHNGAVKQFFISSVYK